MDIAGFRLSFPEFKDSGDPRVQFWLGVASKRLPAAVWDDLLDEGTALFVAHHLAIEKRGSASPAPVSSKSVDKVSVSYDTSAIAVEGAGHWNATQYGTQFYQLSQLVGMGGIQL
jgi:hypothetical protein